jgi:hypothetical protein
MEFRKKLQTLVRFTQGLLLIPSFVRQARKLSRIQKSSGAYRVLALAMASNRTELSSSMKSVRDNLAFMARTLGSSSDGPIAQKIRDSDVILMFDPLPVSRFWRRKSECYAENVFIIDGAFLIGFWIFRRCKGLTRLLSSREPSLCQIVQKAYSVVFQEFHETEAVFFTFNSVLTELLRAYLVQSTNCKTMYEIMHGIGDRLGERYFASMLVAGRNFNADDKHFFIPQIPNLPLQGVYARQAKFEKHVAINAYLNKYFIEHPEVAAIDDRFIRSEYDSICKRGGNTNAPLIITILGNYPTDHKLFDSASFKAECLLIALLSEFKCSMKSESVCVYVPHPLHSSADFDHPIFVNNQVVIYRSSVFCWLISDLCISLESSAMFEAVHFGARSFTPLTVADALFAEPYLDLLYHPKNQSYDDLAAGIKDFLILSDELPHLDIVAKAKKRLSLMVQLGNRRAMLDSSAVVKC